MDRNIMFSSSGMPSAQSFDSFWSIDSTSFSSTAFSAGAFNSSKQQQLNVLSSSSSSNVSLSPPPKSPTDFSESVPIHFTEVNKMSLFSLEKRIDYHLSRIMKGHRLINFKNSIERLSTEKRICECILEVLMSSVNLINRKTKIISESKMMAEYLSSMADMVTAHREQVGKNNQLLDKVEYRKSYLHKLVEVKTLAIGLEQIIWALNSNKEHIKYIVKVFKVPSVYQRSEFTSDLSSIVPMRTVISTVIRQCEEVITICRLLRAQLSDALIQCFMNHF